MVKNLCLSAIALGFGLSIPAQEIRVFDDVPFYSMYHYLGEGENLPAEAYSQIPNGSIRLHGYERDIVSRKLNTEELSLLRTTMTIEVDLFAACDNYDRIAGINLALVPKGSSSYTWGQEDVKRLEIGRFITPFMNKNKTPTSVPYQFSANNISAILRDSNLMQQYDAWIELRVDGYSAAANEQVAGCAGRTDVFRGSLKLVSAGSSTPSSTVILPLSYRQNLNNYNATDVIGTTTRIIDFNLDQPLDDAFLHLISSNHGANTNGEEYARRDHFVYLDNTLIHHYKPGGQSCENFRHYNTQSNGIYGGTEKPLRNWLSWNNWCPGDKIPNREINLGHLSAGPHRLELRVPDAIFSGKEGYFPISMYIQNSKASELESCEGITQLNLINQIDQSFDVTWQASPNTSSYNILYGRKGAYSSSLENLKTTSETQVHLENLTPYWYYETYVQSQCTDKKSHWIGPVFSQAVKLGTLESSTKKVTLFPNPSDHEIHISSSSPVKSLSLYSMDGKKIQQNSTQKLDLSNLKNGVYTVSIILNNDDVSSHKIIKK